MKTITIRQRTKEEGFRSDCPAIHRFPYIIEIDGKPLENVRKFELTINNDSSDGYIDMDRIAQYAVTYYGMTYDDFLDGVECPGRKSLKVSED